MENPRHVHNSSPLLNSQISGPQGEHATESGQPSNFGTLETFGSGLSPIKGAARSRRPSTNERRKCACNFNDLAAYRKVQRSPKTTSNLSLLTHEGILLHLCIQGKIIWI